MRKQKNKKVVIAMSGGVDSSVAAALLKKGGFYPELGRRVDVIGVFMKFWSEPFHGSTPINTDKKTDLHGFENRCCSTESENRARRVAKILKIPFYVFNFEKEFKKRIVDYFLKEYKAGVTPNPCVVCNKEIKFGLLLEKALKLNADFIATGHYARIKREIRNPKFEIQKYRYKLLRAKDKNKDQSYFLWMLNQEQLKRILFPIGDYTRAEVEKMARKFKLPFRGVRKSQEICFIQTTVNDFLGKYLSPNPGLIVDTTGKELGRHQGLYSYTIGQRKGIGLPGGPFYVLDKDLKTTTRPPRPRCLPKAGGWREGRSPIPRFARNGPLNLLIVTKNEKDLYKKELIAENVNWVSEKEPRLRRGFGGQAKLPLKIKAKIRYRHQPALAIITKNLEDRTYTLKFKEPQRAITPGQSVVFYSSAEASAKADKGKEILGGGIII